MFRLRWIALAPLPFALALCLMLAPAASAATGVTIQNFAFAPSSVTVPAGTTITWTNQDSAPHTATALDGTFDTGTLKQGQSATITLSKAGTFSYICSIHPFMKGTVVVTAPVQAATAPVTARAQPAQPATAAPAAPAPVATPVQPALPAIAAPALPAPAAASTVTPSHMPETGDGASAALLGYTIPLTVLAALVVAGVAIRSTRRAGGRG